MGCGEASGSVAMRGHCGPFATAVSDSVGFEAWSALLRIFRDLRRWWVLWALGLFRGLGIRGVRWDFRILRLLVGEFHAGPQSVSGPGARCMSGTGCSGCGGCSG